MMRVVCYYMSIGTGGKVMVHVTGGNVLVVRVCRWCLRLFRLGGVMWMRVLIRSILRDRYV